MFDDPWKDLETPKAADAINAKRIDADIPWGFFWARDIHNKCLLVLQHSADSTPRGRLPKLKGIEVAIVDYNKDNDRMLVLKLLDTAHRDIFHRLCRDIVEGSKHAESEIEAVAIALARTWRWHHLLRGGRDGRLSPEQQKGLIGELLVLERHLLPVLPVIDAVTAWVGPTGAPKDFEVGRVCIEAKARRGAATPFIAISSEFQLDDEGIDELFLHVVELDRSPSEMKEGYSVSDVARRVRSQIANSDDSAAGAFDNLLSATGFKWEDDYSDFNWIEGKRHLYHVNNEFPRITALSVVPGISTVRYSLSLVACEPFHVEDGVLVSALGGIHGD